METAKGKTNAPHEYKCKRKQAYIQYFTAFSDASNNDFCFLAWLLYKTCHYENE